MQSDVYNVELQCQKRRRSESWGDYADELCVLVDRAYPNLEENVRECIAPNHYLSQLNNPQVSLAMKPKIITEAVAATLELVSYVLMMPGIRDNDTHTPARSVKQDVQSVQFNVMECY